MLLLVNPVSTAIFTMATFLSSMASTSWRALPGREQIEQVWNAMPPMLPRLLRHNFRVSPQAAVIAVVKLFFETAALCS